MRIRKIGLLFLLLSLVKWLQAQESSYIHYGVNDGLPSSEVYQATQDKRGYMWFATDRGIVRFDGHHFKTLTTEDGMESDVVFGFHTDHHDRTWFYSYSGGIGYLDGDSIVIPSFNSTLKEALGSMIIGSMYVDLEDNIWLSATMQNKTIKISPTGEITNESKKTEALVHITRIDSGGIVFGCGGAYHLKKKFYTTEYRKNEKTYQLKLPHADFVRKGGAQAIRDREDIYCSLNTALIQFSDATVQQQTDLPGIATLSLFKDSEKNLWVGMFENGALSYSNSNLSNTPRHILKSHSVSSIYESRDGAYWFTTLDDGIYFSAGQKIYSNQLKESENEEQIKTILPTQNSVWLGTKEGNVYAFDELENKYQMLYTGLDYVNCMQEIKDSKWIGSYFIPEAYRSFNDSIVFVNSWTATTNVAKDSLWIFSTSALMRNKGRSNVHVMTPSKDLKMKDVSKIYRWKNRTFVGGRNGLCTIDDKGQIIEKFKLPLDCWVVEIEGSKDHLFLTTKKDGVLVFKGNEYWTVSTENGLPLNHIEAISVEDDNTIWLGSKRGVSKVRLNHLSQEVDVLNIDINDGLISNEINQMVIQDDRLWVATNSGLSYFSTNESFYNATPPAIYLENVEVNGVDQKGELPSEYTAESVAFDFKFIGLNYRSIDRINYKYRLVGFDEDWHFTDNRQVRYMLPHGEYTFEVLAQNNSGVWSVASVEYSFVVLPPFWLTGWFLTMSSLVVVGLIVVIVKWRWKSIERKRALELQMAKSKHSALTAQLKPHFVFNALNSIHNFIRKNDKENSSKYLVLFSRLIRQILDSSNESFTSLDQEVSLLEKYLEIEQLRFKDKMKYELVVDENIDADRLQIPTQIIQPYVENAIWHGIMNKQGEGKVYIEFSKNDEYLKCKIQDDGIGRAASQSMKSRSISHKSSGMNIGEQRLEIVSAILKRPVKIEVNDVVDEDRTVTGTVVLLTIPILKDL